jgi:hypothetical protein
VLMGANPVLPAYVAPQLDGLEYYMMGRLLGSAATSVFLYTGWYNSSVVNKSDTRLVTPATAYRTFRTRSMAIKLDANLFSNVNTNQVAVYLFANKNAANVDLSLDYALIMPRPALFLTGGRVTEQGFLVKGDHAFQATGNIILYPLLVTGDLIEFAPGQYNHLLCQFCPDETVDPLTTYTVTFNAIYVTPRWALL